VKNLVLLSAGLVVGAQVRRPRPWRQGQLMLRQEV
jgi:hypothetical protein